MTEQIELMRFGRTGHTSSRVIFGAAALGRPGDDGAMSVIRDLLAETVIRERLHGVGVVTPQLVEKYAMSGVVARSCGMNADVRKDRPYLAYTEFADALTIPVGSSGDALTRLEIGNAGHGREGERQPAAARQAIAQLNPVIPACQGHRQEPFAGVLLHHQLLQGVGLNRRAVQIGRAHV